MDDVIMQIFFTSVGLIPIIAVVVSCFLFDYNEYKKSSYYRIVHIPYISIRWDRGKDGLGRYGEYLVYKHLRKFEEAGAKFLFNVYIPKGDGTTTEIDVLMICPKGVFVFESKNYSGWIFGSEWQERWYQTLPKGRGQSTKEMFYNPVMQNRSHIKCLKVLLGEQIPMRSVIVFSDRCTLKDVKLKSSDVSVIKRSAVASVVTDICNWTSDVLSENDISKLHIKLYPFTQVDEKTRAKHVADIRKDIVIQNEVAVPKPSEKPAYASQTDIKCPRCGGNLVLRTAKNGNSAGRQFYGCSSFPKCRYTRNL